MSQGFKHKNKYKQCVLGEARRDSHLKSLEYWLDGVSTEESPKNVEMCKRPAVRSKNFCCPKKIHDHFYIYHIDFGLCDRSRD